MDPLQAEWTSAYRYARKAQLSFERAEDFAQYVALQRHLGNDKPLGLLFCHFSARGTRRAPIDKPRPPGPKSP